LISISASAKTAFHFTIATIDIMAHDKSEDPQTTEQVAPPAPPRASGATLAGLGFTIIVPDLRNGDIASIQQAAPKASISADYKWMAIKGLDASDATRAVEYLIRSSYAQLRASAPDKASDANKADFRRRAIVLGAVRAGAWAAYKLTVADMNSQECVNAPYTMTDGRIVESNGTATAGTLRPIANEMAELTPVEVASIGMLCYLGMAAPVLQGVSLVSTGHHYLPTTKNVFAGMKRQAFGLVKEDARVWLEGMGDVFDDMAFHKACHPISPPFKRRIAKDSKIAARLHASGHGAAAIRLPAIPSDAAIGKTAIALVNSATPVIRGMGHSVSLSEGPALIADLERASEGQEERDAIVAIQNWAAAHNSTLAFCAGITQSVHESVGTGRNTLLAAYSVKKIMAEHPNQVQIGQSYARAANERVRSSLASGQFANPSISM
jgi:hypothetical protein